MSSKQNFKFSRIILFGHQVDVLKSFYVKFFHFTVTEEIKGQWIVLDMGGTELALHKIGGEYEPAPGATFRAESNTKMVFQIAEDLHAFRQTLLDHGSSIGEVKKFDGIHSLFCDGEDPEGNVFQLEQRLL